jgi:nucleoside-diphosphate-sugar epimerase
MHPNDGRVVSNFIIQALQNKDITIYGNGEQTRSFQFVDDLVSGLVALMTHDYTQPVNIGNPDEYTVKVSLILPLHLNLLLSASLLLGLCLFDSRPHSI